MGIFDPKIFDPKIFDTGVVQKGGGAEAWIPPQAQKGVLYKSRLISVKKEFELIGRVLNETASKLELTGKIINCTQNKYILIGGVKNPTQINVTFRGAIHSYILKNFNLSGVQIPFITDFNLSGGVMNEVDIEKDLDGRVINIQFIKNLLEVM